MVRHRPRLWVITSLGSILAFLVALELLHFREYGHFVLYGPHLDVVARTPAVPDAHIYTSYSITIHNWSFTPLKVEFSVLPSFPAFYTPPSGSRPPGDLAWSPACYQTLERWDERNRRWSTVWA